MSDAAAAGEGHEIYYPSEHGTLRTIEEYRRHFLAADLDFNRLGNRTARTLELARAAAEAVPAGTWVDYGCGAGVFAHHLGVRHPKWHVEGWDADPSSIKIGNACFARDNVSFQLRAYDAYKELPAGSADAISILEVIEHVPNVGEMLAGFHQGLRTGGLLVVSTPHFFGYEAVRAEVRRRINAGLGRRSAAQYVKMLNDQPYNPAIETGHVAIYTVPALATVLKAHGFELVSFDLAANGKAMLARLFPDTLIMAARKV
jgi:2-polyprenyl-3-methyl-5-hydroxy-6-metoxy-1,4-benzoquinol methylase